MAENYSNTHENYYIKYLLIWSDIYNGFSQIFLNVFTKLWARPTEAPKDILKTFICDKLS